MSIHNTSWIRSVTLCCLYIQLFQFFLQTPYLEHKRKCLNMPFFYSYKIYAWIEKTMWNTFPHVEFLCVLSVFKIVNLLFKSLHYEYTKPFKNTAFRCENTKHPRILHFAARTENFSRLLVVIANQVASRIGPQLV